MEKFPLRLTKSWSCLVFKCLSRSGFLDKSYSIYSTHLRRLILILRVHSTTSFIRLISLEACELAIRCRAYTQGITLRRRMWQVNILLTRISSLSHLTIDWSSIEAGKIKVKLGVAWDDLVVSDVELSFYD